MSHKPSFTIEPVSERSSAAFFDLDNTLIRGSSFYYFVKGLVSHGVISKRQILRFGWENFRYVRSRKENSVTMATVTRRALQFVQGKSQDFLKGLSEEIVEEFLPRRIIPKMRERILEHQIIGDDTWLITAAPQELAGIIANHLNMSGALGTKTLVRNGLYQAELATPALHGPEKAQAIRHLAMVHNYDLARSYAYSDSLNDLPMLVTVGKPFLVNPEKELARLALKNRWPVIETAAS